MNINIEPINPPREAKTSSFYAGNNQQSKIDPALYPTVLDIIDAASHKFNSQSRGLSEESMEITRMLAIANKAPAVDVIKVNMTMEEAKEALRKIREQYDAGDTRS